MYMCMRVCIFCHIHGFLDHPSELPASFVIVVHAYAQMHTYTPYHNELNVLDERFLCSYIYLKYSYCVCIPYVTDVWILHLHSEWFSPILAPSLQVRDMSCAWGALAWHAGPWPPSLQVTDTPCRNASHESVLWFYKSSTVIVTFTVTHSVSMSVSVSVSRQFLWGIITMYVCSVKGL
jgi:hypothetical protein